MGSPKVTAVTWSDGASRNIPLLARAHRHHVRAGNEQRAETDGQTAGEQRQPKDEP